MAKCVVVEGRRLKDGKTMTIKDSLMLALTHARGVSLGERDDCQCVFVSHEDFANWHMKRVKPNASRESVVAELKLLLGPLESLGVPVHKAGWAHRN